MTKLHRFMTADEGVEAKVQHTEACVDCPFSRKSIPGWLGGGTVDDWLNLAHGEGYSECHVFHGQACAGMAIYRANVCKVPKNDLILPRDEETVFGFNEFREHHENGWKDAK